MRKLFKLWCKLTLLFVTITLSCPAKGASWTDNGSYNISWYNKNLNQFDISTPEQLAGVAYLVNNNFANFSGKTLNIISDINLSGKDWTPVGMGTTVFQGSIEGNNHTISNINIASGTSGSPYASGMWIKLSNCVIKNLNFKGNLTSDINYIGFVASTAEYCTFENIDVNSSIAYNHPDISASTSFSYSAKIAGMIGEASSCSFLNVKVSSNLTYAFGSSSGSNCYGKIELNCGGIVASASSTKFIRCHAINSHKYNVNGYVTTSSYTNQGDSFITYGGIVGRLNNNSSQIIGCLAENKCFSGNHPCGTFDTKNFRFGGIVGYMSKYDNSVLKNCVAMNDSYIVTGHTYTWQASWYHTNSYYGGVAYEAPKGFAGCYSNNDVSKNVTKVEFDRTQENGSTSFSKSQMNSQSFVDELNFFSQLTFDEDYWELKSGKLCIKQSENEAGLCSPITEEGNDIIAIYTLNGVEIGKSIDNLTRGIYIIRYKDYSKKITIF